MPGDRSTERPLPDGGERPDPSHVYRIGPDESPTESVVRAVAAVTGRRATDVEPLHKVVDPNALNALFEFPLGRRADASVSVTFAFEGYEVSVRRDRVVIREGHRVEPRNHPGSTRDSGRGAGAEGAGSNDR